MTKTLSFFVLIFNFVLVRAHFEGAGQRAGIEVWKIEVETGDPKKLFYTPELDRARFSNEHTYIVLQTVTSIFTSGSYNIFYVIGNNLNLEKRKKTVEHVITLWEQLESDKVTITRESFFSTEHELISAKNIIKEGRKKKEVRAAMLNQCFSKRLYKLTRSDEVQSTSNEGNKEFLVMSQVPVLEEVLNRKYDFVYECDSKAYAFNLSGKEPEGNSKKLAQFINQNNWEIVDSTFDTTRRLCDWFKMFFQKQRDTEKWKKIISRYKNYHNEHIVHVEIFVFTPDNERWISIPSPSYNYVIAEIEENNCYVMKNKIVGEAIIYIGSETTFETKKNCLKAGEKLEFYETDRRKSYKVSVTQSHNLSASFILPFHQIQQYFHYVELGYIMQLLKFEPKEPKGKTDK